MLRELSLPASDLEYARRRNANIQAGDRAQEALHERTHERIAGSVLVVDVADDVCDSSRSLKSLAIRAHDLLSFRHGTAPVLRTPSVALPWRVACCALSASSRRNRSSASSSRRRLAA